MSHPYDYLSKADKLDLDFICWDLRQYPPHDHQDMDFHVDCKGCQYRKAREEVTGL